MPKPFSLMIIGITILFVLTITVYPETSVTAQADPASAPAAFTQSNFILPGGVIEHSAPTLADLTGDQIPEILVGTTAQNGAADNARNRPLVLVVLKGDGTTLWSKPLDAPMNSSPTVGDIDKDGQPEVLISTGGDAGDRKRPGALLAFDKNGNERWRYNLVDYFPRDGFGDGAYSSPTLCDVDNDGDMEIALGGWDQRIYLLDHLGKDIWFNLNRPPNFPKDGGYFNADSIWSTAACADLNGDGLREIIIGADITAGTLPDGTKIQSGGFVYVFDKDGKALVRRHFPETIYSSPAVGDLNNDGQLEIVVGTGNYWWNQRGRKDASFVYAFDTTKVFSNLSFSDPAKLPDLAGWPQKTTYPGFGSPALADLDGDSDLEVIIASSNPFIQNDSLPGVGQVHAWHHTGQSVTGWPVSPKNPQGLDGKIDSSPTVADIDNDGQVEVLFAMVWDINVYNPDGSFQEYLNTLWTIVSSPAVGDTDGDGKIDVWIGASNYNGDRSSGHLWRFSSDKAGIGALPWPMFHRDPAHSGLFPLAPKPAKPAVGSPDIFALRDTQRNSPTQIKMVIQIFNDGDQPFDWDANTKPAQVTVSPAKGTLNGGASLFVDVTIQTDGLAPNITHALGNIKLAFTSNGAALPTIELPVKVYVGPVEYAYMPLARR